MPANSARGHPVVPKSGAKPPLQKTSPYAAFMAGEALDLKPKLADSVALKQKPSMVVRPVRRELNAA